jgi:uncharacterized OB-fold protein
LEKNTRANPHFNELVFALLGGLIGAIIMGLVAYLTPPPNTGGDPFFIAAARTMGFGGLAWVFGWLLHVITGMAIGIVFGLVATARGAWRTRPLGNKLIAGVIVGVVVWVALFIPLLLFLSPAASVQSMGSGLVINVLFGLILVVVFGFGQALGLTRSHITEYRCEACGATFETPEDVEAHQREKHRVLQRPVGT